MIQQKQGPNRIWNPGVNRESTDLFFKKFFFFSKIEPETEKKYM